VAHFEAYVRKVVEALREYVNLWVTINEPNSVAVSSRFLGIFPPGKKDLGSAMRLMANQVRAHAAAYRAIHSLQPTARVGIAHHYRGFSPARSWYPMDHLAVRLQSGTFNEFFAQATSQGVAYFLGLKQRFPEARNTQDFFGLNYYTRELVAFTPFKPGDLFSRRYFPSEAEVSSSGMLANIPEGLYQAIQWALRFKLPILITENGVEDASDQLRPRYMIQHLHQVWRAVNFNFPVKGYFHWTLVDNFEWERGWTQRFGLWELDTVTQARRKRPSADLYTEICRENGISSEAAERFAPGIAARMFPD
jgi:beta-glucosidase